MSSLVLVVGREERVVAAVVAAVGRHGITASGATEDAPALAELAAGEVTLLVIGGGIRGRSRELLRTVALAHGALVVETPLRGEDVESYVRREVLPVVTARDAGDPRC
ncbi:hypothetical protein [Streptomyces hainanensis]|uniref:Uncharacterized protein n=1 Tax=Streptomyces hainanensis TaxID=402648 RepID=A0A4R4SVK8_9ACTN|nr:hypothetical protein [Streptomyces hainanensis]TDC68167.1 hypothetical protein E1283_27820 [Streptomyces hainanensis]